MARNIIQGSPSSQTPLLVHRRISVRQNLKYIMGKRVEIDGGDVERGEIPIDGVDAPNGQWQSPSLI